MLPIDLTESVRSWPAADDGGFVLPSRRRSPRWCDVVRHLATAMGIFEALLERGKMTGSLALNRGGSLQFEDLSTGCRLRRMADVMTRSSTTSVS